MAILLCVSDVGDHQGYDHLTPAGRPGVGFALAEALAMPGEHTELLRHTALTPLEPGRRGALLSDSAVGGEMAGAQPRSAAQAYAAMGARRRVRGKPLAARVDSAHATSI